MIVTAYSRQSAAADVDPAAVLAAVVDAARSHPDGPAEVAEIVRRVLDGTSAG